MEVVVIMNSAMINMRLYPLTNSLIVNTVNRLHDSLGALLAEQNPLTLVAWEKSLLINGEALTQKYMERPQVAIILMLMVNCGIRSIAFHREIEKRELTYFLELMCKKTNRAGGERELDLAYHLSKIPNITINQIRYTDQALNVENSNISEEAIATLLTVVRDPNRIDRLEKLRELSSGDPGWLIRTLHAGIEQLVAQVGTVSYAETSAQIIRMLRSLDTIAEEDRKDEFSEQMVYELSHLDASILAEVILSNTHMLDNNLLTRVVEGLECGKIQEIIELLKKQKEQQSSTNRAGGASANKALERLMLTEKGAECIQSFNERLGSEGKEEDKQLQEIQNRWAAFFSDLDVGQPNLEAAEELTSIINELLVKGAAAPAKWMMGQLVRRLSHGCEDVRGAISDIIARLIGSLPGQQRMTLAVEWRETLLSWMASETAASDSYVVIGECLVDMAKQALHNKKLGDSLPVVEALQRKSSYGVRAEGEVSSKADKLLSRLAVADILDPIIEEFHTNGTGQRDLAARHLVSLGSQDINPLLNLLRDSEDSAERVRLLNLISEIGQAAIPPIVRRLTPDRAWYELRNLVWLLGRIGGEDEVKALAPLFRHDDSRVQREVLKGIIGIGGESRGEILLAALPLVDGQVKAAVVAALGSLKYRPAVQTLIEMFKAKSEMSTELRVDLQMKICLALGSIGDPEAKSLLNEIEKSGSLFSFTSYEPKVKGSASKALAMLGSRG